MARITLIARVAGAFGCDCDSNGSCPTNHSCCLGRKPSSEKVKRLWTPLAATSVHRVHRNIFHGSKASPGLPTWWEARTTSKMCSTIFSLMVSVKWAPSHVLHQGSLLAVGCMHHQHQHASQTTQLHHQNAFNCCCAMDCLGDEMA